MYDATPQFAASVAREVVARTIGSKTSSPCTISTEVRRRLRLLVMKQTVDLGYRCTLGRAENAVDGILIERSQHRVVKKAR